MRTACPGCPDGTAGATWAGHRSVVPVSQYESPDRVLDFATGRSHPADDPGWHRSGAPSAAAYGAWASRVCGLACLRALLGHRGEPVPTTFELLAALEGSGAFPESGGPGLVYRPFLRYVADHHALDGTVEKDLGHLLASDALGTGGFAIWSVHPSIRFPQRPPGGTGGHLVLLHHHDREQQTVSFANPSGHDARARAATIPVEVFARFAAPRGMALRPAGARE